MVELLQWGYGEMSKCHGIIFLPPSTPLPPISGCINCVNVGYPRKFMIYFCPYQPIHLFIPLLIPLTHHRAPLSIYFPLPLTCHICLPHTPLYITLPLHPTNHCFSYMNMIQIIKCI